MGYHASHTHSTRQWLQAEFHRLLEFRDEVSVLALHLWRALLLKFHENFNQSCSMNSGIENENEIMSSVQEERSAFSPFKMVLPQVSSMPALSIRLEESRLVKKACEKENMLPEIIPDTKPIMSTKNVIAPRTEDMDSGFLMPCDDTLIGKENQI